MGWTKIAEATLARDSTELTLNFAIKGGYQYLILAEGKIETGSSPLTLVDFLQDGIVVTEIGCRTLNINMTTSWFLSGLLIIADTGWVASALVMTFLDFDYPYQDGSYTLSDAQADLTKPVTLRFTQTDGVLKAGLKIAVLEKAIE